MALSGTDALTMSWYVDFPLRPSPTVTMAFAGRVARPMRQAPVNSWRQSFFWAASASPAKTSARNCSNRGARADGSNGKG